MFFTILGLIIKHKFVQINMNTPNYIYYMIIQLTLRYEHSTPLIFLKT
jgi:hypothetical protein